MADEDPPRFHPAWSGAEDLAPGTTSEANPPATRDVVLARWRADEAAADAELQNDLDTARQAAVEAFREDLEPWYRRIPRPSLLAVVGSVHAVLVTATFIYLVAAFGWLVGLIVGAGYTLAWTVVLVNRADERGRLSRAPAPFRKYDFVRPPEED